MVPWFQPVKSSRHIISRNNKIDIYENSFIKYDIFEAIVTFPPRGTLIGIIVYYCEHYNMNYITQSNNNSPWDRVFPVGQISNFWVISISRKYWTTVQKFVEYVSGQQRTVRCNKIRVITSHRDKIILITNLQETVFVFDHIRHIKSIGNNLISLPTNPPTLDHIGDVETFLLDHNGMNQYLNIIIRWKNSLH